MTATLPLLLVSLGFGLVAVYQARRLRGRGSAPRPSAVEPAFDLRVPSLVALGRIGAAAANREAVRSTAQVAPADRPDCALVVFGARDIVLADVPASRVVMARAWTGGRLALSFGEARRDYGQTWPLGRQIAGWEVHLVDADGAITRCYGMPGTELEVDIDRLRRRIERSLLAEAI